MPPMAIAQASLWSVERPYLYTATTFIETLGAIDLLGKTRWTTIDQTTDTFGVRSIVWDAARGLLLNGLAIKVKGFANHQDFAGVGVAVPDPLQAYRVWKHKEMGANAWRTAHNPPNPALLDECDKQGFLVWDENRALATPGSSAACTHRTLPAAEPP
eukprot:4528775-Prymnesium_polylepis.1